MSVRCDNCGEDALVRGYFVPEHVMEEAKTKEDLKEHEETEAIDKCAECGVVYDSP